MGENTLNNFFHKLKYGDKGADKAILVNDCLDIADAQIKANKDAVAGAHTQGTDQGLDTGGLNAVVVADVKDAVTKRHSQNADTDLDATFEATIAKHADKLSAFAPTTSAELAGVITDETGTDKLVYNTSPTFLTDITAPIINLTGGQIAFPATAVPSANANTLDDYEEGEWTTGIAFGGGVVGITYSLQAGLYTKIGRMVIATGIVSLSAKGTSTGAATITGLPFSSINDNAATNAISIRFGNITFANILQGHINANAAVVSLGEVTEAGVVTSIDNSNFADNSYLSFSITYFTN